MVRFWILGGVGVAALGAAPASFAQLAVTQPVTNVSVAAGDDFATETVADPWDMSDGADVRLDESHQLSGQTISNGFYQAVTTGNDPHFYAYFGGYASSVPTTVEARHRIPSGHYRYFTTKLRLAAASGPTLTANQPFYLYFFKDNTTAPGWAGPRSVPPNSWQIVTVDLDTDVASPFTWATSPTISSLRYDMTVNPGVNVQVDWIRLTSAPSDAATSVAVSWSDSGSGPYQVSAVDGDGAVYVFANALNGHSFDGDFSRLAPGAYQLRVSRAGATAISAGTVTVNSPPRVVQVRPDQRGNVTQDFAAVITGNPWGPMDAGDIAGAYNVTNQSFSNPTGTYSARPTSSDPHVFFDHHGQAIDASRFRSLCFELEVAGPREVGNGSIARLFWGNNANGTGLTTSDNIVLQSGLNQYCIADMASIKTRPAGPSHWSGQLQALRLDPHELPVSAACNNTPTPANCHDFNIDSLTLAPFYRADPIFNFQWTTVSSRNVQVSVWLDPDTDKTNGNEIVVGRVNGSAGSGHLRWVAPASVAPGRYNVLFGVDDDVNQTSRYASGPLLVVSSGPADLIFWNGFEVAP